MKKPPKTAPARLHARYKEWVRLRLKDWDPLDDRFPGTYTPRYNGINGDEVEKVENEKD